LAEWVTAGRLEVWNIERKWRSEPLNSLHLGTRARLFDFAAMLEDTRVETLQLSSCSLSADRHDRLAKDVSRASDTCRWIGKSEDLTSPTSVVAKLGYDLFLTKGVTPRFWDSTRSALRNDGMQEFIKLLYALLLAYLLFRLDWGK